MPDSNESPRKHKKKKIFCEQETLSPCTSILPAHQAAKFACIGDTDAINDLLIDVTAAVQNDDLKSLTITYSNNTESSKYSLTQPKLLLTLPKSTRLTTVCIPVPTRYHTSPFVCLIRPIRRDRIRREPQERRKSYLLCKDFR